jgi:hypothetical protein
MVQSPGIALPRLDGTMRRNLVLSNVNRRADCLTTMAMEEWER